MAFPSRFEFGYDEIVEMTGMDQMAVYQHRQRGNFNPESLESLVVFLARHGRPELKEKILRSALTREPFEGAVLKATKKAKKAAPKSS